jgi:peptidoglycan-associated lipoprotein
MLKIMPLAIAAVFVSSCSTIGQQSQHAQQQAKTIPSHVAVGGKLKSRLAAKKNDAENIISPDSSVFELQNLRWNYDRSSANSKIAVFNLRRLGAEFVVYFPYNGVELSKDATQEIIRHANFLNDNPTFNLRLEGHADERGTREYNLALGENRAMVVKDVLDLYGLSSRVSTVSFGEENPRVQLHDETSWEKNRRVEFIYQ